MDLYMQIGVLFAIMTAFALLIFYYSSIIESFIPVLDDGLSDVSNSLKEVENRKLEIYDNNISVSGSDIERLIRGSYNNKIAVFLQTKNQGGRVVNYGYQLRATNNKYTTPNIVAPVVSGSPTLFESYNVMSVGLLFNYSGTIGVTTTLVQTSAVPTYLSPTATNRASLISLLNVDSSRPVGYTGSTTQFNPQPRIFMWNPLYTGSSAKKVGKHYLSSGRFYTDQELKLSTSANRDFGFLNSQGSAYRLDKNARYYSILIEDSSGKVVGVYVEQHGVRDYWGVAAAEMVESGLITAPF